MRNLLYLICTLFLTGFAGAAEIIEVGKPLHSDIQAYYTKYYTFVVPEMTKYKISLTNAQSDLGWSIADDVDDPTFEFECDLKERKKINSNQDEVCDILLKPGTYYLLVDEWSHVNSSFDLLISSLGAVNTIPVQVGLSYQFDGVDTDTNVFLLDNQQMDFLNASVQNLAAQSQLTIYNSNLKPLKSCNLSEHSDLDCFRLFKRDRYYFEVTNPNQSHVSFKFELKPVYKETLNAGESTYGFLNAGELKAYAIEISKLDFYSFLLDQTTEFANFSIYDSQFKLISTQMCNRFDFNIRCNMQLYPGTYYLRLESYENRSTNFNLHAKNEVSASQIALNEILPVTLLPVQMQTYDLNLLEPKTVDAKLTLSPGQHVSLNIYDELGNWVQPPYLNLKAGNYRVVLINSRPENAQLSLLMSTK